MAAAILRIPITNVYGGGDYTAQIKIGSAAAPANVRLDTGSSTLAVYGTTYDPSADAGMQPTTLAQDIVYGTGGWTGPVVTTSITIGSAAEAVSVGGTYVAITADYEPGSFGNADGILGLAFNSLNGAYNLAAYLADRKINPQLTYPWPFQIHGSTAALRQFRTFLSRLPQEDLTPYFTSLESAGVTRNIFALYTLRSTVRMQAADPSADPMNNGYFVLGGGPEQNNLYQGDFTDVDVMHDTWYNTNLIAVQVAGCAQVNAQALPAQYAKTYVSNSIIDSGTNGLILASDVYAAILSSLEQINPNLTKTVQQAEQQLIPAADLNLGEWPDITFILTGKNGAPAALTCTPSTYWQLDSPAPGQAVFQIKNSKGTQSILGLPLLNNYYTVFDRTQDPYGAIRFATIAPPA